MSTADEEHLRGSGWVAERTPEGCTMSWLTNHPRAHIVSAEATATISDADFEQLRRDPDSAGAMIDKYEPTAVIR